MTEEERIVAEARDRIMADDFTMEPGWWQDIVKDLPPPDETDLRNQIRASEGQTTQWWDLNEDS